jgi:23S rRNA (pseudouridine1915-N3)-methyltransferase
MSRELHILWAGRHRRRSWDDLCADYRQRIERDLPVKDRMIKVKVAGQDPKRLRAEETAMLRALPDPAWTIALDARGRGLDSQQLARRLGEIREEWPHPIVFMIGSDLGLGKGVVEKARLKLSLGPMTYGHELARLMLYEQIYRAISIGKGIKYHRPSF